MPAVAYLTPGVYVEEVDRGTKPIQAVGTSLAAFIGITEKAPTGGLIVEGETMTFTKSPVLVTNWTQYKEKFGGFVAGAYLPDAVFAYFNNGGGPCYVVSLRTAAQRADAKAATAATVEVPSGAKRAAFRVTATTAGAAGNQLTIKITRVKPTAAAPAGKEEQAGSSTAGTPAAASSSTGAQATDEVEVQVGSETQTFAWNDKSALAGLRFSDVMLTDISGADPKDGIYTLTGGSDASAVGQSKPLTAKDITGDLNLRTGLDGLQAIDEVRLVLCPDVMAGYDGSPEAKERVKGVQQAMIDHCANLHYRFAVLDTPPNLNAQQAKEWREYVNFDSSYAAMYYPWVKVADLETGGAKFVPPGGHMVGIYNRVDAERGVHKAPANEILRGVIDLETKLTKGEQDILNPIGVNCIRAFPNRGIRAWGARTLSSDGAWRYINVRRLFIFVEASMEAGLQWVVFEPNDSTLWAKVRRDVTSFLRNVWRSGALFGAVPSAAFYVKCDEELNPPDVRDVGQLIIEVGMCPVKPAEFVIFRISQWAGANAESE
jgi:phage tail sheath protein FI